MDTINARVTVKHDTTANWNVVAGTFTPKAGEIIVYDDYQQETVAVNIYNESANPIEQGAIASANGQDSNSNSRIRTNGYISVMASTSYSISTNMARVFVLEYSRTWFPTPSYTYLNISSGWQGQPYTFTTSADTAAIRIVLDNNSASITPSAFEWLRIYNDSQTVTTYIPGIKIGTGNAYVGDLPFIDEDTREELLLHINNGDIHVTANNKSFWNNKINIDDTVIDIDTGALDEETLIFTRL